MPSLRVQRCQFARGLPMTPLRQRMVEDMQIRNFSENTQESYLQQVSQFARHFRRSPEGLGPANIRDYQLYLTNDRKLAPGSILIATAALRFLYIVTMKRPWDVEEVLPMPKKPEKLPVILSPEEVQHFLSCVPRRKGRTVLTVCYAAGFAFRKRLRLSPPTSIANAWSSGSLRARARRIAASCSLSGSWQSCAAGIARPGRPIGYSPV